MKGPNDIAEEPSPGAGGAGLVRCERPGEGVLVVTLARPEKRNALSKAMLVEMAAVLRRAEDDPAIAAVVLTGTGTAFSAGADITDMLERGVASYQDPERLDAWAAIERFGKPLIAAVNGYALGGGFELMLLCDFALACTGAQFGCPEIKIGSFPGDGGTQRLARRIGYARAAQMVFTGEPVDAIFAERAGLVSEVTTPEALLPRAVEIAGTIALRSSIALRLAKEALRASQELPLGEGVVREHELCARSFATEDRVEGLRAFKEKRPPRFKGR